MRIIDTSFEILTPIDNDEYVKNMLLTIENAGRTCYKSNQKDFESTKKFIASLIKSGHESVIEHQSIIVRVICSRSCSHQIVRHRLASYSQESQRYCNYNKDKFDNEIKFIKPDFISDITPSKYIWIKSIMNAEHNYFELLKEGCKPEQARTVLPNSTATEIVMTLNIRGWRHFFKERVLNIHAEYEIRELFGRVLKEFQNKIPILFDDLI